jgi:hypothetical protein
MPEGAAFMRSIGIVTIPVIEAPMDLDAVLDAGTDPIQRAAERAAALVELAGSLG